MLAKLTSKNQLILPKSITAAIGTAEYFDVEASNGRIVLTPVRIQRGDAVRAKLAELDLQCESSCREHEFDMIGNPGTMGIQKKRARSPKTPRPL